MKNTLLFLLIPFLGYSQIDVTKLSLTSDTTLSYVDTSMWVFYEVQMPIFEKQIRLFQADLVIYKSGMKHIPKSIGPLPLREYREALNWERDARIAEKKILLKELDRINAYIEALVDKELLNLIKK